MPNMSVPSSSTSGSTSGPTTGPTSGPTVTKTCGPQDKATRWLTEEQQKHWRAYLLGSKVLTERLERDLRCLGLSLAEYEILVRLSEEPGHTVRMSELASGVHQSRSRLTHTIGRLEKAGYVGRCKDTGDGRGVSARLTPKGHDFLVDIAPRHVESVREALVDALSDEEFAAMGRAFEIIARHNSPGL